MPDLLLAQTQAARARFFECEGARIERLAREGQAPQTLFIGCSDSRVMAEALIGAGPGDLFVVRVVANVVPPHGSEQHGVGAAIEFAVDALQVKHIVVCGHTECGGIRALDTPPDPERRPNLARWLHHARPALDRVSDEPRDPAARHLALVEANVLVQLDHLRTYPAIRSGVDNGAISLHGWVFDLAHRHMHYLEAETGCFVPLDPPAA